MTFRNTDTDFDIAIAGGGLVGAALACALGETSLRIGLFDSRCFESASIPCNGESLVFDARVSAIAPSSRRLLEQAGAWPFITAKRLSPYTDMEVWDAEGTGSIHFSADDIHESCLGYIIENSVILAGLYRRLEQISSVSVICPAEVKTIQRLEETPRGVMKITGSRAGEEQSWTSTLLVGADGPASRIRQLAGFQTREWEYQHEAIVTTVRTELPHRATALQRFMSSGPLAFLPLCTGDGESQDRDRYCSIVWSLVPERAAEIMDLEDTQFARLLAREIEHRLGKIEWVDRRFVFPLWQRHAVDYVQPNIVLVGDAAHTIHPLAGQGVNLGFRDVEELTRQIQGAIDRRRHFAEMPALRAYQRARKTHNLHMMGVMEGFKFLFAQNALPVRWLRNAGMSGIDQAGFIKNRLMREAMGVRISDGLGN